MGANINWILDKLIVGYELDSCGSGQKRLTDFCEHGNEPSASIENWEFLEWLSNCWLFKKDSVEFVCSIDNHKL
jgi:hypothetical protein